MRLLTVIPEIKAFLGKFRPLLSRRQFRHFCRYIIGLLAQDRKNIRRIASSCIDRIDQSNLNRFMHSHRVDDESIQSRMMELVWRDAMKVRSSSRPTVLLLMDDSLIQKFAKHMEGTGYLFSPKDGKSILCHDIVTSFMIIDGSGYPVDVRLYVREDSCTEEGIEFKTRIELACELIRTFKVPDGLDVIVLFDSWYLCREVVDAVHARGWHYVSEAKSNRKVVLDGEETRIDELPLLLTYMFRDCAVEEKLYSSMKTKVRMRGLGDVNLVMKINIYQKGPDEMHFILSDIDMDVMGVILTYDERHRIDEFYRDSKQTLGLGEYMVRDIRASNRHWRLVFVAYTLLILLKKTKNLVKTVGEMCDWIREKCIESLLSMVYSMSKRNVGFSQIKEMLE